MSGMREKWPGRRSLKKFLLSKLRRHVPVNLHTAKRRVSRKPKAYSKIYKYHAYDKHPKCCYEKGLILQQRIIQAKYLRKVTKDGI